MVQLQFKPTEKHPQPPRKLVADANGVVEVVDAETILAWYPDNFTVVEAEHKAAMPPEENKVGLAASGIYKRSKKKGHR